MLECTIGGTKFAPEYVYIIGSAESAFADIYTHAPRELWESGDPDNRIDEDGYIQNLQVKLSPGEYEALRALELLHPTMIEFLDG